MEKIKKNPTTGLYNLSIGNQSFESKRAKLFMVDLNNVKQIVVADLPYKIKFQLEKPVGRIKLSFIRSDEDRLIISLSEFATTKYWSKEIHLVYYFKFKSHLIYKELLIKPQLQVAAGFTTDSVLEYSLELNVTTIGEAINCVLEIDNSLNGKIDNAIKKALSCMELVLNGGLQIKLPKNVALGNKNNKNSKV